MPLTCYCPEADSADWYYLNPTDFTRLDTARRKRCASCGELINIGAEALKFIRWRDPRSDVEEWIHGDSIYLADWWMCEKCGEQFFNLEALGYCVCLGENMMDLLAEYREMDEEVRRERFAA